MKIIEWVECETCPAVLRHMGLGVKTICGHCSDLDAYDPRMAKQITLGSNDKATIIGSNAQPKKKVG